MVKNKKSAHSGKVKQGGKVTQARSKEDVTQINESDKTNMDQEI